MVSTNLLIASLVLLELAVQSCICQPIVSEEFQDHLSQLATEPRVLYDGPLLSPMTRERRQVPVYFEVNPRTSRYAQMVSGAAPARQYGYPGNQEVVVVREQNNRYGGYPNSGQQTTVVVVPEETGYRRTGYIG